MDLPEFHMKHLLQEEIEVIIEKEFCFTIECCVRASYIRAYHGSVLIAKHEDDPRSLIHKKLTIALVDNDSVTVGHIPNFMFTAAYPFLEYCGHIKCKITCGKK